VSASVPPTSTSTELAVDRTRLAHDRTMMAWVRTAASLISFGFTIYKFFQYMREQGHTAENRWLGPREFALALIAIGLFSLGLATLQSRHEMRIMRKHYARVPYSLANIIAGMVAILGVLTFVAVMLRQ
jgi:putative membrane protein